MIKSLENGCACTNQNQRNQEIQSAVITDDFKLASTSSGEIFSSSVGHVSADTRITFKGVAYTPRSISAGKKISRVHSSTVSSTGGWSSPSEVSLASDLDGHAVLSFDLLNQIPRSGDLFGWVNNLDAFIKDHNVGLQEDQVSTKGTGTTDSNSQHDVARVEKALNNEANEEGDKDPSTGDRASGSELFTIRHFASFSQMGSTK